MDYVIQNFFYTAFAWGKMIYESPILLIIKIFAAIYLATLIVDIILLLILRDVPGHVRTGLKGANIPTVSVSKMRKRWDKVKSRLDTGNVSQLKVAIIEADQIADEMLKGIGYKGANMTERLEQVGHGHLDEHLEALQSVHQIRNRIVHEADFEIDQKVAQDVISVYENFLKYLEFLD